VSLELIERNSQGAGSVNKSDVIAGERYDLSLFLEKVDRRQMKRIQSSDRPPEGLQGSCEHRRGEFNKGDAAQQRTHFIRMRSGELERVNPSPNLTLKETAGDQRFLPELFRGRAVFGQKMCERNRGVEIDQRSLRSWSNSRLRSRKDMTGLREGGPADESAGGLMRPWRTASASNASASTGLRCFSGGTSSATTRSRSVTSTVSPFAARRTYSLSLFLRTFNPTALMASNVASSSYRCQVDKRYLFATELFLL
jgi:hypothetical protein